MADTPPVQSETKPVAAPQRRRVAPGHVLSFVVGLVGVAALAAAGWVYTQTQRDVVRLSTDIAQLRLSLELFNQQQGAAAPESAAVTDLANRLAILEENWRNAPAGTAPATLPEIPTAPTTAAASDGDCLPTGTRFLVGAGDSYPICGVAGTVEIASVDNGFLTLGDGTVIAAGGNIGLPGTACMIAVVSAGQDGMTGFGEIRVTC
ncbi:MAG TPA: hypothetical protein VIL88_03055 [Devosia sp.]|uniref:hypothetical protein n=1 Tax=Devosia sp. TaxID=1871048 RepID=UPI002F94936E